MIKIHLIAALACYVSSARLDNLQYLPPQGNSIGQDGKQSGPNYQPPKGGQYQPSNDYQKTNQFGPGGGSGSDYQPTFQQPTQRSPLADVPILSLDSENPGDGTYRYAYETGNDIAAQEQGSAQSGWNKAQGSYRFVSPEGENYEITYTADENGYVPQGAHLPTPPPIPEAILKSLEVIRQAEAAGNILEGAYQPEGDDGQYHEGHDEGQYNQQGGNQGSGAQFNNKEPSGGQQQPLAPNGGYKY